MIEVKSSTNILTKMRNSSLLYMSDYFRIASWNVWVYHALFGDLVIVGFVGKDVAEVLGYSNYRNAIVNHVDDNDKLRTQIEYAGQKRDVTLISESGLYSLILSSKLSKACEFKHWVSSEVLPQIRKTGGYIPVKEEDDLLQHGHP